MAEGDVATEKPRDWKRPAAWAIAAFAFFSIATVITDRTVDTASKRIAFSLLMGFGFAAIFGIAGIIRTLFSRRDSYVMIPFVSAGAKRSVTFIALFIIGLIMKAFMAGILVQLMGFLALGTIWVARADYFHHGLDAKD
jgi:hypothetical protein